MLGAIPPISYTFAVVPLPGPICPIVFAFLVEHVALELVSVPRRRHVSLTCPGRSRMSARPEGCAYVDGVRSIDGVCGLCAIKNKLRRSVQSPHSAADKTLLDS